MLALLYPIASLLGIEAGELVERIKKNGALWGAIALFSLIALIFGLIAAHTALALWVGPIYAPLIIAAVSALIAVAVYLVSHAIAEVAHRREVQRRRSAETTALVTTATVTAIPILMKSPLMRQIGIPVGGALAALYLLSKAGVKNKRESSD
jgi:uncharacterized integral membrane protein